MGQIPPPWHGQAVATQILFDHDWPGFQTHRLPMEFSDEMVEVGRFQWKKIKHLFSLIGRARAILKQNPGTILLYPPASAKWVPFLRDVAFLTCVRPLAGPVVFIFHASGLPAFVLRGRIRRLMGHLAYHGHDVALEVAQEPIPPHLVFSARAWRWCPCGIQIPEWVSRERSLRSGPFVVLFVGSLQEGKGVMEILKTALHLKTLGREHEFFFRIVGKWFSEEFEKEARQFVDDSSLLNSVEFVGQLTGDDKWQSYAEADVFFFPTHYASEATPIVLMEALGMGLPILATQWAGIPAMLEGCETATLLPIRSPEQYAAALITQAGKSGDPTRTTRQSRHFYQANFLPERFIERVEKAFQFAAIQLAPEARKRCQATHSGSSVCPSNFGLSTRSRELNDFGDPAIFPRLLAETTGQRPSRKIKVLAYLADQNPGHDRSYGISRMSQVVLESLHAGGRIDVEAIVSRTSQRLDIDTNSTAVLPWGTRLKSVRLLTDHLHPLFLLHRGTPDIHYFPKGYLPLLHNYCKPSVVTIHDTIIQYDFDHYRTWRKGWEYRYWEWMLKHTLRKADRILTVSESAKRQVLNFMDRHGIPSKEITVTYEPCLYESIPQPLEPNKMNYVMHLASSEPHKRTAHLIRWWHEAELAGQSLPILHLIGSVPTEVSALLASSHCIVKQPFLEESALQAAYLGARALILPSEIEGFGLPALEAYYLGTPVCFVKGTSVEEVLSVVTDKGGFSLDNPDSLWQALSEVMAMTSDQIHTYGLKLRETYAAEKVAARMVSIFEEVKTQRVDLSPADLD